MKTLPATDPRSWRFQANIHGTLDPTTNPLFNQCEHGTFLFLAWHRGYLYYFERILRWASGDPGLTLPYWDWTHSPAVPEPYRSPASESNPLYEEKRALNDGSMLPAEVVVDALNNDLAEREFSRVDSTGFTWGLEGSPHGTVHTLVGGQGGTMSRVPTAANDPIFWLHHCNIDRLWDHWLNLGEGRANPTNSAFLDKQYSYADETGRTVTRSVRDMIGSGQLGYRYDTESTPVFTRAVSALAMAPAVGADVQPAQAVPVASSIQADQEAAPSKPLGLTTETVRLRPLPVPARAGVATPGVSPAPARAARPSRYLLRVEGISFEEVPDVTYGVYLNIPEGQTASPQTRQHLAGTLNFFGNGGVAHGHGGGRTFTQTFDATKVVARLQQSGRWNPNAPVRVDLRPLTVVPPAGAERTVLQRAAASLQRANVRYRSVQLLEAP